MIFKFEGPRLKIKRAKTYIEELRAAESAFFDRNPYEIVREQDGKTGEYVYRIRVKEAIPCDMGVVIGDVVHNLRAALDQLVCDLVRANRGTVTQTNAFLITGSRETFEARIAKKIAGISAKAERLIRRLKPYERGYGHKTGCAPLYWLDALDDLDKHKGIIPVGAAQTRTSVIFPIRPFPKAGAGGQVVISTPDMAFAAVCPVTDNAELLRIGPSQFDHQQPTFTISISIADAPTLKGKATLQILDELVKFIEKGIGIFERRAT